MKKHYKFIILGIVIGLIISGIVGYAQTVLTSKEVVYDNTNSKLSSTNVKDAIDEVNTKATKKVDEAKDSCPNGYECNPIRYFSYISGEFTANDIRTQKITDYTTLGKAVFAFADARTDGAVGICVNGGENVGLLCIKPSDSSNTENALVDYFVDKNGGSCSRPGDGTFGCGATLNDLQATCVDLGDNSVRCYDYTNNINCTITHDRLITCS